MGSISASGKTDQALVRDTLRNPDAFGGLVERYEKMLRRYVTRLGCRNPEDAEDVLQNIFLKIYVNLNEYDERLKFSSWAYRLAHNETVSFFRKKKIRPSSVETEEELVLFDTISDTVDILESLNEKMDAECVRAALEGMDEQYRDVLILKYLEEKSYDEISDILKIPAGTVATRISRGKKKLRERMISKKMDL